MTQMYMGIDVGWSCGRPSCGVAWTGFDVPGFDRRPGEHSVGVTHVRLDELAQLIATAVAVATAADTANELTVVLDGPIATAGLAAVGRRAVDEACTRGLFSRRAQSALLVGPFGANFVRATNDIVAMFGASMCWTGGPLDRTARVRIVETNPTVAMAVTLPVQAEETLPSRRRARYLEGAGAICAKSDWYWHLGASRVAARILGAPWVIDEGHHDRVAALYCLALAVALGGAAADGSSVIAMGAEGGAYLLPASIDPSWRSAVEEIGIRFGSVAEGGTELVESVLLSPSVPVVDATAETDEGMLERDRAPLATLTDNGGLHLSDNPWLSGASFPCRLRACANPAIEIVVQDRSSPTAPYRIEPTALTLARELRGFDGSMLSATTSFAIAVEPTEDWSAFHR